MRPIPLVYTPLDKVRINRVLERYGNVPHTTAIDDFEKGIAAVTGARHVIALNSGTAAIHLGLMMLNVKPGDEVMVSTFTYVASVNPIVYLGAKPVFIDSETDTWNMDPEHLSKAISERMNAGIKPKAIILVHAYGMPAKLNEILQIASEFDIPVLEDAAEALGSRYHGRHVGTFGKVGVLSFNNNKILTTYGGGALLTDDTSLYEKARFMAEQAREDESFYKYEKIGYNYRMGSVNAITGLAWIDELDNILKKHREIHDLYKHELEPLGARFLNEIPGHQGNHWVPTFVIERGSNVPTVIGELKKEGIEGRFLWNPMHTQPVFRDFLHFGNSVSQMLFQNGMCLPSGYHLQQTDQQRVIQRIKELLA